MKRKNNVLSRNAFAHQQIANAKFRSVMLRPHFITDNVYTGV